MPTSTPVLTPVDLSGLSDHDLLAGGLCDQVAENLFSCQRLARLEEFRCRLEQDYQVRRSQSPRLPLTPLQEAVIEAGELWGYGAERVRSDLKRVRVLREHFPGVWELCRTGQLDGYRASLIADTVRFALGSPKEYAAMAKRVTEWLRRGSRRGR